MTDIGRSETGAGAMVPGTSAQPVRGEEPRLSEKPKPGMTEHRKHGLWESLTASLDLACRGYLCMQVVDCDPVTDPDCSAAGKKVVMREIPVAGAGSTAHEENDTSRTLDDARETPAIHRMI
jgi:hypothetical protein